MKIGRTHPLPRPKGIFLLSFFALGEPPLLIQSDAEITQKNKIAAPALGKGGSLCLSSVNPSSALGGWLCTGDKSSRRGERNGAHVHKHAQAR